MSAIFGLIRFDEQPVSAATLAAMQEPMAYWGTDQQVVWHEGSAGLGQLLMFNTPEARYETLPLLSADGNLVLMATARLDNRAELCDRFGIPHPQRPTTPDGQLILHAYAQWGEESPKHLLGDWSFAVWHRQEQRLFVARDHFGNTALYYHHNPRFFAFASSLKGLLALHEVPRRLNEAHLACQISLAGSDVSSTARQGIYRLPIAHRLSVTANGIQTAEYWRLADAPDVRLPSDDDYVARFTELYDEAVRCRLRSLRPVATTLSAGLDSSSIMALAARELKKSGQTLPAFTWMPFHPEVHTLFPKALYDEWPLAHAAATWAGNVEHIPVRAETVSPLHSLERSLWLHAEPEYAPGNLPWILAMLSEAQQRGLGAILTGQVGNHASSWAGDGYAAYHLLRKGNLRAVAPALRDWRQSQPGVSWWHTMSRQLLLPLRVEVGAQRFRLGLPRQPWRNAGSTLQPAFAQRLKLSEQIRAANRQQPMGIFSEPRLGRIFWLTLPATAIGALYHEAGAGYGLEMRDPSQDVRLLAFCLGIPNSQYLHAGQDRWLNRRAMAGLLPPEVVANRRRGFQASDLPFRVLAEQADVEATLARALASPALQTYLDPKPIWEDWTDLKQGITLENHLKAGWVILRHLMWGLFLELTSVEMPL